MHYHHAERERGSTLIVVVGLGTLLMCLVLAVTFRVRNAVKASWNFERTAESHIMMQTAKLLIQGRQNNGSSGAGAVTAGDDIDLTGKGKPFADHIGWVRVKPAGSSFEVIASGGPGGDGGAKSGSGTIASGDPTFNSYDTRFHYRIDYDTMAVAPASKFKVQQLQVQPNALYPW